MDAHLAAIGRLDAMFHRKAIEYWLFGGWGVDFHAGRVTRLHNDIDVAIWKTNAEHAVSALVEEGWSPAGGHEEDGFRTFTRDGVDVDVAFVERARRGSDTRPKSGRGEWPDASFGRDVLTLAGTRAHVVSAASLLADKSGLRDAASASKDAADVEVLRSVALLRSAQP
jgi:hypothetical protein